MITLYNVCNKNPVPGNRNYSFCRNHPFYTAITLLGVMLALCYRQGYSWTRSSIFTWASSYMGCDLLAYTLFLLCNRPKAKAPQPIVQPPQPQITSLDPQVASITLLSHTYSAPQARVTPITHFLNGAYTITTMADHLGIVLNDGSSFSLREIFPWISWHNLPLLYHQTTPVGQLNPIQRYTRDRYVLVNRLLRSGQISEGFEDEMARLGGAHCFAKEICTTILDISAQIISLPLFLNRSQPYPHSVTYRVAYFNEQFIWNHFAQDREYVEPGFVSTSKHQKTGTNGVYKREEGLIEVFFTVYGSRGRDIAHPDLSITPAEGEVLFLPFTSFIVKSSYKQETRYVVELQEVVGNS